MTGAGRSDRLIHHGGTFAARDASITTQTGLTVQCRLDQNACDKGIKVSNAEMARLNITPANFHGECNYTIAPRKPDD
jgi:hypothetical protein